MSEQRFNEVLGRFEECPKCTKAQLPGPEWERAFVSLGHPDFAVLFGTVMRVGDGVWVGQLLVGWELEGEAHSQDWRHTHEVTRVELTGQDIWSKELEANS